jgi:hypothetical protein
MDLIGSILAVHVRARNLIRPPYFPYGGVAGRISSSERPGVQ